MRGPVEAAGAGGRPAPNEGGGEPVEVEIESIASGGAGVGRLPSGKAVFVHRTAPGDRVRVRIREEKKRWARGRVEEVLRPGPGRREPECVHYARCGGCTLEHLAYRDQLRWKARIVRDALVRIGKLRGSDLPPIEASPREFRYRNRVSFTLVRRRTGNEVLAGFHELERPGRILDVDGRCLLPEEELARVWDRIRKAWGSGARRLPPGARLRLTLRRAGSGAALVVEGGEDDQDGDPEGLIRDVEGLISVWRQDDAGAVRHLAGEREVAEWWAGERFRLAGTHFLQVNRGAAEQLYAAVLRMLGSPRGLRVVDGYCGIGIYGRRLAHHGAKVVGIERDAEAVRAARRGAPGAFRVLEGAVEDRIGEVLPADLAILNPPRSGLDSRVTEVLRAEGPERLIYVSCDPATLARDVRRMDGRYRLTELRCFDLFPQTTHVETVAVLEAPGGTDL